MIKKIICVGFILITLNSYAQNHLTLEINGVHKNSGLLYVSVFNSEQSYDKKNIYKSWEKSPIYETVLIELNLPDGEYLFSVYQDSNGNKGLDKNILGIPKEPVGLSNYDGKGVPGNFDKLKVNIDKNTFKVKVTLVEL
jgi:uncharacterized protein (DUF2141 family)